MAHNRSGRQVGVGLDVGQVGLRGDVSNDLLDQHYGEQHGGGEVAIEQHPFEKDLPTECSVQCTAVVGKRGYTLC